MSNWVTNAVEALKVRFESHVKNTNASMTELASEVSGAKSYVESAVASVEARMSSQATALQELQNKVRALELKAGSTPL